MRAFTRGNPAAIFSFVSLAILTACVAVRYGGRFAANSEVAAWGITFDLTITVPLCYWFFLVRSGRTRPLTIAPVFLCGVLAAKALLPGAHQEFVRQMVAVVSGAAVVLMVTLVWRAIASNIRQGGSSDPYDRILAVVRTVLGGGRVSAVVASEVTVGYYAFFGWGKEPEARERSVSFHERSGWGTIVACILVLIAAEGLAMHLLLARWNPIAAWAWTALDVWAVIWLLGDYQALRLRPTWLDDSALHLRQGLRWSVTIPRDLIVSIRAVGEESEWKRRDVLTAAMLEPPRWLIVLREPVTVRGLAGMRKTVVALALLPDRDAWIEDLMLTIPRAE